jgi:hypothetical protein
MAHRSSLIIPVLALSATASAFAQSLTSKNVPVATTAATVIPALVRYDGVAQPGGKSPALMTFFVFKDEQGGEPLWTESQNVSFDASGHFEAYLGAASNSGLPLNLFGNGEARWLEVQIAGEKQQPRVLLASVPYAVKAADAATLGGLPASAFALASAIPLAQTSAAATPDASSSTVTTPGGTAGYVPVFSGTTTIDDSILYESGTEIGIGTKTPASTLDVNGTITGRGALTMESTGSATATTAKSSQPIDFMASAYNSSTKKAVAPIFALQSEAAGNNTTTPSGTLNLLYGNGAAPAETGLSISNKGIIKFATGQTFPGGSGAITGVTAGTDLIGGGTSGTVKLSLDTTKIATLSGSPVFKGAAGDGAVGDTAGTTLNTAGLVGVAGSGNTSGYGGIAGVWGNASAHVGILGTSDQYAGVQGISGTGQGVLGTSTAGNGVQGGTTGTFLNTAGVFGVATARTSFTGIAGVWGDSSVHVGLYGTSNQAMGVLGSSVSGAGVEGTSTSANGVHGVSQSTSGIFGETSSASTGDAALYGYSHSNAVGVYGYSAATAGVSGNTNTGNGVQGSAGAGTAVRAIGDTGYGLFGSTTSGQAVAGSAQSGIGGSFSNNSNSNATLQATNYASAAAALLINSSSSQPAVVGINYGATVGMYGYSPQGQGIGIEGNSIAGIGVYATTNAQSTGFQLGSFTGPVALWADSTPPNGDGAGIAVVATANGNNAGYFTNNSQYSTIYSYNYGSGNSGTDSLFNTLEAASPKGTCGFGGNGDLACTGQVKALVETGGGARKVETYAMQSPENWMEDFGSATLQNGVATVSIDPVFAETISASADYHVFLTPNGDSRGLYVLAKTPTGFEVHESGGGKSTLNFDYRIVAKRRGYEAQRLVDVTDRFTVDKDHFAQRANVIPPPHTARN